MFKQSAIPVLAASLLLWGCSPDAKTNLPSGSRNDVVGCNHGLSHGGHHSQTLPAAEEPFDNVSDYIDSLDRDERVDWQRPDRVVEKLELVGDELVVDLGSGSGYFAFPLARQLPWGRVVAMDTEAGMVSHVNQRASVRNLTNLTSEVVDSGSPDLPDGTDLVFVCNVLHYVPDRRSWLCNITRQLESGDRVALIGFVNDESRDNPNPERLLSTEEIRSHACAAGLAPVADYSDLLPRQFFMVFSKW